MIPAEYANFLVASTQASAALIGLLFVSVSIAPERVFGGRAEAVRQSLALSAFTALANIFFVSFGGLIPHLSYGVLVTIAGTVAASQTLALLPLVPNWRREGTLIRGLGLFAISAVIYGAEIAVGVRLVIAPSDPGALSTLLGLLLGGYSIGLARAWELLGAPRGRGALSGILEWLERRVAGPNAKVSSPTPDTAPKPDDRA